MAISDKSDEIQNGSSELIHYGVKGMKWGVRKDQESQTKNKKIKGATTEKTPLAATANSKIPTSVGVVEIKPYDENNHDSVNYVLDTLTNDTDRYMDTTEAKKLLDSLPVQKDYSLNNNTVWGSPSRLDEILDKNAQGYLTNHDAPTYIRSVNCFECSMAYELRRRGYDVQSKEMDGGLNAEVFHAFDVKDAFKLSVSPKDSVTQKDAAIEAYRQLEQRCLSYGEGARGCLGIQYYDYDSGHSMIWTVENGKFKIIDSQHGGRDGYETFLHADVINRKVSVQRLDNAEVLPGVMDFVEPRELTDEEKAQIEKLEKAKKEKEAAIAKQKEEAKAATLAKQKEAQDKYIERMAYNNKNIVEKAIANIGKATKEIVSKGKEVLTNLFKTRTYMVVNGERVYLD